MLATNPINYKEGTICALATPPGSGAIAMIRLSGSKALSIGLSIFRSSSKNLSATTMVSHHAYFGQLFEEDQLLDEVLFTYFKGPHSYTGEDVVEISCHGSSFIQQKIIQLLLDKGSRLAEAGEFTLRAFLNGKLDLSQAEAVADLIASQSKTAHQLALKQMRGGFSEKIADLRQQLLNFTALIALELDFSEEDVEFADRTELYNLLATLKSELEMLVNSFKVGNVIKKGIPVAIVGKPNTGKSTLLNAILNEEKAIVSDIPGTTRDFIEDTIVIDGYTFRFIDTAGLRQSEDQIENLGIERTYDKIDQATIILYVCDLSHADDKQMDRVLHEFNDYIKDDSKQFILVGNKIDQLDEIPAHLKEMLELETVFVSAKRKENIHLLAETLVSKVKDSDFGSDVIVSNTRHYDALSAALSAVKQVEEGFNNDIPTDLVDIDIKQALHYLGTITGEVTTEEVLGTIFSKFCIGK